MKFAHVNHRYAPFVGGSERYVQEVSETLAAEGHDVSVITSDAFDLEYFWNYRRKRVDAPRCEIVNGVQVRRVPVSHPPMSSFVFQGSRRAMGELSRVPGLPASLFEAVATRLPRLPTLGCVLDQLCPIDLIHATNVSLEGPGINARKTARAWGIPFVITPFLHLGQENDVNARRYISMPHQKSLMRSADTVIVMTQLEASFVKMLGIDPDRIVVSGVGVYPAEVTGGDAERFRSAYGVSGGLVGVASAVAFDKGSKELVEAVASLRRRGHDVSLVLAGPRLEAFERWFRSLPEPRQQGIILPGFITAEEKRDMLAAIDVLAMPSRTESFGIAYLEGWVNSKPVIAARAGAVPELVVDGMNGLLVEFGDSQNLAEAILRLLSDAELARDLADAGRSLTMSQYTWPAVIERVKRAYSLALGHKLT